jgi:hypothetical protein
LKLNAPKERYYLDQHYVDEYHRALEHLAHLGFDVKEFEIPRQWMEPITRQVPYGDGFSTIDTNQIQVVRAKFLTKLDAVLEFFSLTTSGSSKGGRSIGFTGPRSADP